MPGYFEVPSCAICYEEMLNNLAVTKCGHIFHRECIDQAWIRTESCPLCRAELKENEIIKVGFSVVESDPAEFKKFLSEIPEEDKNNVVKFAA